MNVSQVSLSIAFIAGIASFLSPCVLPLVPIYLAQLVGPSVYQAPEQQHSLSKRVVTLFHAMVFVAGFTLTFVALGATASALGSFLNAHLGLIRHIGGVLLVIIGLHLAGVLKLPFMYWQKRIAFQPERPSYIASFLIGIIFGVAWTPCTSPILGAILLLTATTTTLKSGVVLLLVYSLGLGIPFLILGLGLNQFSRVLQALKPHLGKIEMATGILLMGLGAVVFFNLLNNFNQYFTFGLLR